MASMKTLTTRLLGMAVVAVAGVLAVSVGSVIGQSRTAPPSTTQSDRPNLNGIWQALNEANFDLEPHSRLELLQDILDPAAGQELSLFHNADARAEIGHFREDVAGNEDGTAHLVELLEELAKLQSPRGVEP